MGCDAPCKACLASDRSYCTQCLDDLAFPQLLYQGAGKVVQTCVNFCPPGFASSGTKNPRKCLPCADTCSTCAQADLTGDVSRCLTCQPGFPFYQLETQKCFSNGCPDGTYQSNNLTCTACKAPCQSCSAASVCTRCDAASSLPYLFVANSQPGVCVSQCTPGYTPVGNKCVRCTPPCATCDFGLVKACKSCDNTASAQYLYGLSCVDQCPANTTLDPIARTCKGCNTGCALCDPNDVNTCLKCSPGLALLDNACLQSCPFNYLKSLDGSVCEERTYPLDSSFVSFPILGTAGFFFLIAVASYWLTGRRSLVSSSVIAFLGPIEMAACAYQFWYALRPDRSYRPIMLGSVLVLASGVTLNILFVASFIRTLSGRDKEFERWKRHHRFSGAFFLILAGTTSLTVYRLIFCRIFRLGMLTAKMNKPWPFIQHILMFSWIRLLVFNLPLVIVDIVGLCALQWGNQCFMAMLESLILSLCSLGFLIWETRKRTELIVREGRPLNLDKMELLEADGHISIGQIVPAGAAYYGATPNADLGAYNQQKAVGPQVRTKGEKLELARTIKNRLRQLQKIVKTVKKNTYLHLNNDLDVLLHLESEKGRACARKSKSMADYKTKTHNNLQDEVSERSEAFSFPNLMTATDEEIRLRNFQEFVELLRLKAKEINNKGEQYFDPEEDNVYAEAREPEAEVILAETEAQTDQEKNPQSIQSSEVARMADQVKDTLLTSIMRKQKEAEERARKQGKSQKRGRKGFYENVINEEDDLASDDSENRYAQTNLVQTQFGKQNKDILTLALQLEGKNQFWDLNKEEQGRMQTLIDKLELGPLGHIDYWQDSSRYFQDDQMDVSNRQKDLKTQKFRGKGIELSRVSDDLDFSDGDIDLENDETAKKLAQMKQIDNVQAWIKDQTDQVNQRNFNENDVIGNFERDWSGQIINRDTQLLQSDFVDRDGNQVNERGYIIDDLTGDVRSRYSFEVVFKEYQLIGATLRPKSEIPFPFRLERHNFNPHQCFGNFDFNDYQRPIILKDKTDVRIDKNLRSVNQAGWLIDTDGNIIDNIGRIKFLAGQLDPKGDLPKLYNYDGKEYRMKDIMGIFERDKYSKEIVLCQNSQEQNHTSRDLRGRKVNPKGYLLDQRGNIIDRDGNLVWRSHELMFNEPPKIFPFTQFSINWIRGNLDRDVTRNPKHDDEFDLDGARINTMGYLIDDKENVIDAFRGAIVFRKEILENRYGQEAEIPYVFRSGKLLQPKMDELESELHKKLEKSMQKLDRKRQNQDLDQLQNEDMDLLVPTQEHGVSQSRENLFGMMYNGKLAPFRDLFGQDIGDIPLNEEQQALMDSYEQNQWESQNFNNQPDIHASPHIASRQNTKKNNLASNEPELFKRPLSGQNDMMQRAKSAIRKR